MTKLGIGIATYNRRDIVRATIERVRALTRHSPTVFVVADDGSTDGTQAMLREMAVPFVTGRNMGVAWNKNRALYLLNYRLRCDVTILLEDDTRPAIPGWEQEWIAVAREYGHANAIAASMRHRIKSGAGTAADPILSAGATAHCAVYSSGALERVGYFDPRFRGYGHEHVEHSARLVRGGAGGTMGADGEVTWVLIEGGLEYVPAPSFGSAADIQRNLELAQKLMADQTFRAPWRDTAGMRQFLGELDQAATPAAGGGFDLAPSRSVAEPLRPFVWGSMLGVDPLR